MFQIIFVLWMIFAAGIVMWVGGFLLGALFFGITHAWTKLKEKLKN